MSKKLAMKKFLKVCLPIIGLPIILSAPTYQLDKNSTNIALMDATAATPSTPAAPAPSTPDLDAEGYPIISGPTPIPEDVASAADVTTGVAVIKTGYETLLAQDYIKSLANPEEDLKTFLRPYFWKVLLNPITNLYQALPNGTPTYTIRGVTPDNKTGSIKFECLFPTAVEAGKKVTNKVIKVAIPGFKKITGATRVIPNPSFPFADIQKQTLVNSPLMLKNAIIIENLPDAAVGSVTYTPVKATLTNPGSFDVEVTVSQYYNDAAELQPTSQTYTVTLSGLSETPNTTVVQKADANYNLYGWELTPETIKTYIDFVDLPPDAVMTIDFDPNRDCDNKTGTVNFNINLSHYWKQGILLGTAPTPGAPAPTADVIPPLSVTLSGFKTVTTPSVVKTIPGLTNFYASSITPNNIRNYFDISTFPLGVTFSGGTFTPDDAVGTLTVTNLQASVGYNNDAKFSASLPFTVPEFSISGLLTRTKTTITVVNNDLATNPIIPTQVTALDITQKYVKFTNLPPWPDISVVDLTPDNLNGTVTFKLHFSSVYDDKGNLVSDFTSDPYTISGFATTKPSSVTQKLGVDLSAIHASELNERNITNFVDFTSFPKGTDLYNYVFSDADNTTGTVNFSVTASSWYDDKGVPMPLEGDAITEKKFDVTLNNFAIQKPTVIKENPAIDNSGTLASSITTTDQVKELFIIENESTDTEFPTTFFATNFKADNIVGQLTFTLIVNNYYDEKGIFNNINDPNYKPLVKEYTFTNYRRVGESVVKQIAQPTDLLPTDFLDPKTALLIPKYLDTKTFPDTATFKYEVVNPINKLGKFDLNVTASSWYDQTGNLINTPNRFLVHMVGCKTQDPTKVIQKAGVDLSTTIASDVDTIDKLANYITFVNPYEHDPIPGTDWSATNYHYKNAAGKLTVDIRLNQYYDTNGNPVKPGSDNYQPMFETIELSGFKPTEKSTLKQKANPATASTLPTTVKAADNWKDFVDFSTFPPDYEVVSATLSPIDKDGTLSINATIKNFYNEAGNIDNNQQVFSIELSGFATQTKVTSISANANADENLETSYAINLINTDLNEFFNQYVTIDGEVPGTVKTVSTFYPDNAKGVLTVSVNLNQYYDSDGNKVTAAENKGLGLQKTIEIPGFKKNQKTTMVQNPAFAASEITPSAFCDEFNALSPLNQENKFKEVVKIDSPAPGAIYKSFNVNPINIDGTVQMNFVVSAVYNANGDIINEQQGSITLKNFKVENPSKLVEQKSFEKDFPATDLTINVDNFWTFFDPSAFPPGVNPTRVEPVYFNDEGRIDVTADFPQYYDVNGNLMDSPKTFVTSVYGFNKITSPSELLQNKNIESTYLEQSPTEIINLNNTSQTSRNNLFNKLVDTSLFPTDNLELGITGSTFNVSYVSGNNIDGTLSFTVRVNKYYGGNNNNLVNTIDEKSITLQGFKKIVPSTITVKDPHLLPSQVTYADLVFNNFDEIPPADQVIFRDVDDDTGTLTIVVQKAKYNNKNGVQVDGTQFLQELNVAKTPPPDYTPLIIGASVTVAAVVVVGLALFGWRKWYKKTHEV